MSYIVARESVTGKISLGVGLNANGPHHTLNKKKAVRFATEASANDFLLWAAARLTSIDGYNPSLVVEEINL